jgi:hypothetical protein
MFHSKDFNIHFQSKLNAHSMKLVLFSDKKIHSFQHEY